MACGVFALVFIPLSLCLPFFYALCLSFSLFVILCSDCLLLVLLSCLCFPALSLLFLFPLRTMRKKERAQFLASSLVLLWYVQILVTLSKNSVAVALAFSSSFGLYSQLIQQESDGLPVLTFIRSGIMSI